MTDFAPTHEQSAILDAVAGSSANLMIRAHAGCGKTSTLQMIATAVPAMKAHGIDRLHQVWIEMYGQWHDRCGEILERAEREKAT